MKKMNNKGFAITTIVYGLSIMGILLISIIMGLVSTNRTHNRMISKQVAEELANYSKTSTAFNASIGGSQKYVVPENESGWYKIELWGAQGGGIKGGLGAYTSGIIELNAGDTLYFYVGKHKNTGEGGEESDVRIISGGYEDVHSYATRIMVAAGGGAEEGADGGTLYGYSADLKSYGGQYDDDFNLEQPGDDTVYDGKTDGTLLGYRSNHIKEFYHRYWQHSGYSGLVGHELASEYYNKLLSPRSEDNGGDGFRSSHDFGTNQYGYRRKYGGADTGGASYISGYGGCYAVETKSGVRTVNDSVYIHYDKQLNQATGEYEVIESTARKYIFLDGMMYAGVNKGDGKARITKMYAKNEENQALPRHNSKLNNIRYVVSCVAEEDQAAYGADIVIMVNGRDYIHDRYHTGISASSWNFSKPGLKCTRYDLRSEVSGIDEIDIWQTDEFKDYKGTRITVGNSNDPQCSENRDEECSVIIKGTASYRPSISETKTYNGIRFSAYQFDSSVELPDKGNYIIQPVLYENMVMTAPATAEKEQNPITVEYMSGDTNQQWTVERVYGTRYENRGPVYKIVDLARFKALSVKDDENKVGNKVIANRKYNSNAVDDTQLWIITPMKNGTYTIETVLEEYNSSISSGYLVPQTNKNKDDYNKIIISKKTAPIVQRFKFISTDYSSKE